MKVGGSRGKSNGTSSDVIRVSHISSINSSKINDSSDLGVAQDMILMLIYMDNNSCLHVMV